MTKEFAPWTSKQVANHVAYKLRRIGIRRAVDDVETICKRLAIGEAANGYCDCGTCNTDDPTVDLIRDILKENGYLKDPIKAEEDKR